MLPRPSSAPEVQANAERAGRQGEVSGRSYGRYFQRWMHLSQAMERITGKQRMVKDDFRVPEARKTLTGPRRHPT